MTAITTAAHIDAQTQEDLMRQAGIWIEHSTLIEDDLPARPLAAVQAEKHHLDRYTQLVADRAAARGSKCLAQIEEPAGAAPAAVARWGCEDRSAWFALAMGAAASLEDAANCLRDKDAQKAAMGAATHVRESCNKLWWSVPALEAPAAPVGSARQFIEWMYSQPEDREPTTAEGALLEFEAHLAAAAPQAPAAPAVDAWLQPDDMAALQRFHETAEDDESYDIGKEAVARLCAFGCLQSHSFGRYSTTDFGDYLLDTWAGARTLPFTTAAERAAQAAAKGADAA